MCDMPFEALEMICLGNRMKRSMRPLMFREISRADFFVMNQIDHFMKNHPEKPGIYASRIAAQGYVSRAAVSRQLQQLENRGWIARTIDPSSKRNVFVSLTEKGKSVIEHHREEGEEFFRRVIARVGEDRMRQALELFRDIVSAMEQEAALSDTGKGVCE